MNSYKGAKMSGKIYIIEGKRTPFGKFGGSLMNIAPVDLAVHAGKALLADIGLNPEHIESVILGNVVPSSTDTMYGGRHLALKLGMKQETPGIVINRLCGSGIQAIFDAVKLIKLGEYSCVMAAGVENMSMVPHLTYGGRFGTKYGQLSSVDMLLDALTDKYAGLPMGITAENLAQKHGISREECDQYSYESHDLANKAYENNLIQGELAPVIEGKVSCSVDEHLRSDIAIEQMQKLRASFVKDGVVTPGSASGIVDGAAVAIIASEEFCEKHGITPLAEIVGGTVIGVDPKIMGIGPVPAINQLLAKTKTSLSDIDLVEINEAFAAQTLACVKELSLDRAKLNIWGGAIALGHPLAASGVRITHTLARQLKHHKLKQGIAAACIGGGQGIAIQLKAV
jgi:acetyl-CoA acyltransferase 2